MSRKVIAFALVSALGMPLANAADGTITFNGELTATTCTVAVNNGTGSGAVTLPTVTAASLDAAGKTAGQTSFNIQLTGCIGTANTAAAFFEAGSTVNPLSGNLRNTNATAGAASNVNLQLLDSTSGTAIKAGDTLQRTSTSHITLSKGGGGSTTLPYAVQYFATGKATPGAVGSAVTYSIDYQ